MVIRKLCVSVAAAAVIVTVAGSQFVFASSGGHPDGTKGKSDPCFTQFINDLKACQEAFCPGPFIWNCDEVAYADCRAGARECLKECHQASQ